MPFVSMRMNITKYEPDEISICRSMGTVYSRQLAVEAVMKNTNKNDF